MASPKKINLGVFAQGEIPYPFQHTFLDSTDVAIDLTAFTATVSVDGPDVGPYGQGVVAKTDAVNGIVQYTWTSADFADIGKYKLLIWVDDGTNRLASDLVEWQVYDGPDYTP